MGQAFKVLPPSPSANHDRPKATRFALLAQFSFIATLLGLVVFCRETDQFQSLGISFVAIVLEAMPFMLLGTLAGGFIEVFVPRERLVQWLPQKGWLTVFVAAGFGLLFPVCECAIVPVVRRLLQKGMPLGAAIAFLLGGPIVNPIVAASTAVAYAFDLSVVANRLIIGYAVAVIAGLLIDVLFSKASAGLPPVLTGPENPEQQPATRKAQGAEQFSLSSKLNSAVSHAAQDFFDIGRFLIIGAFLAALLQSVIPRQILLSVMHPPILSIAFMMVLAFVLSLCSEADAFVAASFRTAAVPLSAQLAFMILGPMLDIKLVLMYTRVFHKKLILALAGLVCLLVCLAMLAREFI